MKLPEPIVIGVCEFVQLEDFKITFNVAHIINDRIMYRTQAHATLALQSPERATLITRTISWDILPPSPNLRTWKELAEASARALMELTQLLVDAKKKWAGYDFVPPPIDVTTPAPPPPKPPEIPLPTIPPSQRPGGGR